MCEREIYNSKWRESARESGGEIDRQIKCETAYNRVGTGWWVRAHSHIHSRLVNDVTFTIRGPTGRKESGTWHTSLALLYCFYHMSTMHLKCSLVWLNMSWFQIQSINQPKERVRSRTTHLLWDITHASTSVAKKSPAHIWPTLLWDKVCRQFLTHIHENSRGRAKNSSPWK